MKENVFFTADTHFHHAKIIRYCDRPFSSVQEMDDEMIREWNRVVGVNDRVYHLGDFGFFRNIKHAQELIGSLNGVKYLVAGSHDKLIVSNYTQFLPLFRWIKPIAEVNIHGVHIALCHYAMLKWPRSHYGSWQLYGHSHGANPGVSLHDRLQLDVGVDVHGFKPIEFSEVKEILDARDFVPVNAKEREANESSEE